MIVEGAHIVEPEDVIGVPVRVNDRIQPLDAGPQHLRAEIGRGVDDDVAVRDELIRMEGRSRVSRGSVEWQTSQEQPMVGTPELVPEPSTVIFRFH